MKCTDVELAHKMEKKITSEIQNVTNRILKETGSK